MIAVANEEHLGRLRCGVAQWNAWRKSDYIKSRADLHGADLIRANLSGADLRGADLRGAHLMDANLIDADLAGADLTDANLTYADLVRADLSGAMLIQANLGSAELNRADLTAADLRRAILRAAHLQYVNMRSANLAGADLAGARLNATVLGNVDLTGVTGLETCLHDGPSVIDHRTLQISGSLPEPFLRGVGLPDTWIGYLRSLHDRAIEFYSCFISYSTKDREFAERLHADLQNNGVRCWFAPHDLPIGGKTWDEIDEAIRLRDKVLLILSKHSIKSDWVEDEVSKGFAEERRRGQTVIFPIRLDEVVMDTGEAWARKLRDQRNIGDFRRWKDHDAYKKNFDRLLRDLKRAAE
jgi:hypothetical protein